MAMLHRSWPPFPPATDLSTGERGGIHGGRLVKTPKAINFSLAIF